MRARLGFSIATSVDPDILLLDEVLATGDETFRAKSKARVVELVRQAKGVVFVTHDMNWVTEFCNRAILLQNGRIVAEGDPAEVVEIHKDHSRRAKAEREAQLAAALAAAGGGVLPPDAVVEQAAALSPAAHGLRGPLASAADEVGDALRVLTVARWYPSHDGPGRGTFVADLVGATAAAGVDARVVSFDRVLVRGRLEARDAVLAGARAAFERVATPEALFVVPATRGAPGVPVARLPVVRRPGSGDAAGAGRRPSRRAPAVRGPPRRALATRRHPCPHRACPDGIAAATVGRELGIPVVVTEHASTIEAELADPAALDRYRTLLEPGARLLAVSPPVAARLAGAARGRQPTAIGVLPNPVDDAAFALGRPGRP